MMEAPFRYTADNIDKEKMKKLRTSLDDQSKGIDTIRYSAFEDAIYLVPYRSKPDEKGFGSFIFSETDFQRLKATYSNISFIRIGSMAEPENSSSPIQILIRRTSNRTSKRVLK